MITVLLGIGVTTAALVSAFLVVTRLLLRHSVGQRLPSFAGTGHVMPQTVPVLMYHFVSPTAFERELQYLQDNGYQGISLDTLANHLRDSSAEIPDRPVVLTFDDGHRCLYDVAFPLLQRYGYQAVAYICPYWVRGQESAASQHEFIQKALERRVSWEELMEMETSGWVNVQSHSFDHHKVFQSARILGWYNGRTSVGHLRWDDNVAPAGIAMPPLGFPILPQRPRFSHTRRFFPDPDKLAMVTEYVAEKGGKAFFENAGWDRKLARLMGCRIDPCEMPGRFETDEERRSAIYHDLFAAKRELEQHLKKTIEHLAFPWNEGSLLATRLAVEAGYRTCTRGIVNGRDLCCPGDDPMFIPRLKTGGGEQHTLSLPGCGRRGALGVAAMRALHGMLRRVRR
jgi:hypothetical protein